MIVETVNCLVGVRERPEDEVFRLQTYRAGPMAVPATEIPILQTLNGLESISEVSRCGEYETTKAAEFERLQMKYPPEVLQRVYPSAAIPMPKTIAELELTSDQMDKRPRPAEPKAEAKAPAAKDKAA